MTIDSVGDIAAERMSHHPLPVVFPDAVFFAEAGESMACIVRCVPGSSEQSNRVQRRVKIFAVSICGTGKYSAVLFKPIRYQGQDCIMDRDNTVFPGGGL